MHKYSFVVAMVPDVLKKDATSKERDLEGLDVNVCVPGMPCISANAVRDQSREEAIEVEEEEDGAVQG